MARNPSNQPPTMLIASEIATLFHEATLLQISYLEQCALAISRKWNGWQTCNAL